MDFIGITIEYDVELSKLNLRRQVVWTNDVNSAMQVKTYKQAFVGFEFSKEC